MKLNDAEETKWIIELRDGALELQRVFEFAVKADLEGFTSSIGDFVKSPSITVFFNKMNCASKPTVMVRIRILPEQSLLRVAGEIAATCEHEYSLSFEQSRQSAA